MHEGALQNVNDRVCQWMPDLSGIELKHEISYTGLAFWVKFGNKMKKNFYHVYVYSSKLVQNLDLCHSYVTDESKNISENCNVY